MRLTVLRILQNCQLPAAIIFAGVVLFGDDTPPFLEIRDTGTAIEHIVITDNTLAIGNPCGEFMGSKCKGHFTQNAMAPADDMGDIGDMILAKTAKPTKALTLRVTNHDREYFNILALLFKWQDRNSIYKDQDFIDVILKILENEGGCDKYAADRLTAIQDFLVGNQKYYGSIIAELNKIFNQTDINDQGYISSTVSGGVLHGLVSLTDAFYKQDDAYRNLLADQGRKQKIFDAINAIKDVVVDYPDKDLIAKIGLEKREDENDKDYIRRLHVALSSASGSLYDHIATRDKINRFLNIVEQKGKTFHEAYTEGIGYDNSALSGFMKKGPDICRLTLVMQ